MSEAFTSRILKGGALLDDVRRLVEVWDPNQSPPNNFDRVLAGNLLGKRSQVRLREVLELVLKPRFIDPGPEVMASLGVLRQIPNAFRDACYYETARVDPLIARFAEEMLYTRHLEGRTVISVSEVEGWLGTLSGPTDWSPSVTIRVAQGLLAALRDFGILEGSVRKRLVSPRPTISGFAYSAYREYQAGSSARGLLTNSVWHLWLLEEAQVRDLFSAAEAHGVLSYAQAGSAVRIDWRVGSLEDVARAAA